jgi:hypothetical protein
MVHSFVRHRVELPAKLAKLQGVADDKITVDSSLSGFGLRSLDDERHEVDAPAFMASGCEV